MQWQSTKVNDSIQMKHYDSSGLMSCLKHLICLIAPLSACGTANQEEGKWIEHHLGAPPLCLAATKTAQTGPTATLVGVDDSRAPLLALDASNMIHSVACIDLAVSLTGLCVTSGRKSSPAEVQVAGVSYAAREFTVFNLVGLDRAELLLRHSLPIMPDQIVAAFVDEDLLTDYVVTGIDKDVLVLLSTDGYSQPRPFRDVPELAMFSGHFFREVSTVQGEHFRVGLSRDACSVILAELADGEWEAAWARELSPAEVLAAPVRRGGEVAFLIRVESDLLLVRAGGGQDPALIARVDFPRNVRILDCGDCDEDGWPEMVLAGFVPAAAALATLSSPGKDHPASVPFQDGLYEIEQSGLRARLLVPEEVRCRGYESGLLTQNTTGAPIVILASRALDCIVVVY